MRVTHRALLLLAIFFYMRPLMAGAGAPVKSLVDGRGRVVSLVKTPVRIGSSSLASDEILIEILAKAHRLNHLIAVSTLADDQRYSNITAEAKGISARMGRDLEATLSLDSDLLILASYNTPEILNRLSASSRTAFVLADFTSLSDIAKNIRIIGQLVHAEREGDLLAKMFTTQIEQLGTVGRHLKRRPKVLGFYEDGTVSGQETLFDDLVKTAGGENLAATIGIKGWTKLSSEALATLAPDLLITGGNPKDQTKILTKLRQIPGWAMLKAVKEGRLLIIPENQLGATSQHVLKALASMQPAFATIASVQAP